MKINKITAVSLGGKDISNNFNLEYKESDGVTACYISGECEEGFKGDESLVLTPVEFPVGSCLAIENHSPFWCRPYFGNSGRGMPERTMELLVKSENRYFGCLAVCADTLKTLMRGIKGGFEFWSYTNIDGIKKLENQLAFLFAEGEDPHELLKLLAKKAAELLDNGLKMREERSMPELFKKIGWCSWDALQIRVSHEGLLVKAREFEKKNVPVGFAIIDDMWAQATDLDELPDDIEFKPMVKVMHRSALKCFEGSKKRFPKGMSGAIADLKEYIPHVGVWFPTTGYWRGLCEEGETFEQMKDKLVYIPKENGNGFRFNVGKELNVDVEDGGKWVVKPDSESADYYFDDFMSRVKSWGSDFVKIDNQGCHTHYKGVASIGQSGRVLQNAIDKKAFEYFDGALINCMGMPSECMFNRQNSAISRCSDDFMPENRAWFSKNILQCSYNGLLQGQYYINDWDMWWTDDEQAVKNSVCRSISGGPVYVSDKIGRTRAEVLAPVCFDDGRISVCDFSAKPTADCLVENPTTNGKILKIFNRMGETGVIAAYNIDAENKAVSGSISAKDAGIVGCDVAYYEYFSGECGLLKAGESLDVALGDNDEFKLYTLVPVKDGRAVFGRIDKYVSRGAVTGEEGSEITLYEGGKIGLYSENPVKVYVNGKLAEIRRVGNLVTFNCVKDEKNIRFE